jgi:aryl-alcohol dehydrogenase-like predicted oxidoreductase
LRYRPLGRTGIRISAVSLGTVALGVEYGIDAPGEFGRPDEAAALALLRHAADSGITLVDTAPAYGESEALVGRAIGGDSRVMIATKVSATAPVAESLDASRRALGRATLDIVQIHNATADMMGGPVTDALLNARRRGVLRFLGATVYGEEAALAAIDFGQFDLIQVALNVLDQRMLAHVVPRAVTDSVAIVVRSAFLKGALTPKAQWLPAPLAPLAKAAEGVRDLLAGGAWEALPEAAFRYCLSVPSVSSVLSGARTVEELDQAMAAEAAGPLSETQMAAASKLGLTDERLLNPTYWPLP